MELSWEMFSDRRRAFQFEMCGRLLSSRKNDVIIDAAITFFEAHTSKPYGIYVTPFSRAFPDLNALILKSALVGPANAWLARHAGVILPLDLMAIL